MSDKIDALDNFSKYVREIRVNVSHDSEPVIPVIAETLEPTLKRDLILINNLQKKIESLKEIVNQQIENHKNLVKEQSDWRSMILHEIASNNNSNIPAPYPEDPELDKLEKELIKVLLKKIKEI